MGLGSLYTVYYVNSANGGYRTNVWRHRQVYRDIFIKYVLHWAQMVDIGRMCDVTDRYISTICAQWRTFSPFALLLTYYNLLFGSPGGVVKFYVYLTMPWYASRRAIVRSIIGRCSVFGWIPYFWNPVRRMNEWMWFVQSTGRRLLFHGLNITMKSYLLMPSQIPTITCDVWYGRGLDFYTDSWLVR